MKQTNSAQGFTLVELLIVMAISSLVLSAVLKVFQVNQRTYAVQEEVAAMQQNVRVARMFLERDIRMAGYGVTNFYDGIGKIYAFNFTNNAGASGTDRLTITYLDEDAGACGVDPMGTPSCDSLPQVTLKNEMNPADIEAAINESLGSPDYAGWVADCYCDGQVHPAALPGMALVVTKPDGSRTDLFFLTGTDGPNGKLSHAPNFTLGTMTYPNLVTDTYPVGSTINFFSPSTINQVTYDVVDLVLRRNGEPIAENIEDVQYGFGLDTDTDTVIDTWINNADLTNAQKDQVRAVRINVLGRTASAYPDHSSTRPAIEDHSAAGAADTYYRRQLQGVVKVRNLGL